MSTEVAVRPQGTVAVIDFNKGFTESQVALLKDTICRGATDDELRMFIYQCERRKLDPFAKQIYAVKRWDSKERREVIAFQTGIDGFRVVAERSGKYAGQTPAQWCGKEGVWKDVWLDQHFPSAARVGVIRKDFRDPIYAVALWREYVQTNKEGAPTKFWASMGANQLAKCAESLALRKAFPEDLGGLYTKEEMGQAQIAEGETKTEEIEREIKDSTQPAAEPPKPRVVSPETGDPLADYVVPEIIQSLAGKRLHELSLEQLQRAVSFGRAYFEREKRAPAGRWVEFFARADEWIARGPVAEAPKAPAPWEEAADAAFPKEPGDDG